MMHVSPQLSFRHKHAIVCVHTSPAAHGSGAHSLCTGGGGLCIGMQAVSVDVPVSDEDEVDASAGPLETSSTEAVVSDPSFVGPLVVSPLDDSPVTEVLPELVGAPVSEAPRPLVEASVDTPADPPVVAPAVPDPCPGVQARPRTRPAIGMRWALITQAGY